MEVSLKSGDIVVTNFTGYQHWSIVSDQTDPSGKPMLISATKRNGTVMEESWDSVTQGKETYIADFIYSKSIQEVISLARSQVNKWDYSIGSKNCEHFVTWVTGKEITSVQVNAFVGATVVGGLLTAKIMEKPTPIKVLGAATVLGVVALYLSKAKNKFRA